MKSILIIGSLTLLTLSCEMEQSKKQEPNKEKKTTDACTDSCCKSGEDSPALACKLTTPELQRRKATVLANLRRQLIKKKELPNGYAFTFKGTDEMIDELTEFVKTERMCCDFFMFSIFIKGDQSETVLEITGVDGAKEFITSELEL